MNRKWMEAAALIIGLPLFLLACEKDLGERGSGKKVTINFTVGNAGYGTAQQILRSVDTKGAKPETVYIPLNDDYFMAATLVPESAEEVRATAAFETGQKIRFVAYNGASEVGSAIYTWNGSKFVADDEPLGVEPDNEVMYHFVAYSFFGDPLTEPDDEDIEEGISPFQDVVWGEKDQKIYDNETSRTVPILMKHKFSRVQVKVDASGISDVEITGISNVVIGGGKKADLTVATGAVADAVPASPVTETMEDWTAPTLATRLSGDKVFYPSITSVTVGTLKIKVNNGAERTFSNRSVTFTQALAENTNYTVVVDVRADRVAWSNIYWTGSVLTFDKTNQNHQSYQGVFFKWGSLVGISPVGTNSDAILYIPPIGTGSWDSSHKAGDYSFPWGWQSGYEYIPYTTTDNSTGYGSYGNYLYYNPDFNNYRGDICNYLDNAWRMPSWLELGGTVSSSSTGSAPNDATGKGSMGSVGSTVNMDGGVRFFPASGGRINGSSSSDVGAGTNFTYWTGSTDAPGVANWISFYSSSSSLAGGSRQRAFPVRCIRKLPTD
jgi:hypothetical protein